MVFIFVRLVRCLEIQICASRFRTLLTDTTVRASKRDWDPSITLNFPHGVVNCVEFMVQSSFKEKHISNKMYFTTLSLISSKWLYILSMPRSQSHPLSFFHSIHHLDWPLFFSLVFFPVFGSAFYSFFLQLHFVHTTPSMFKQLFILYYLQLICYCKSWMYSSCLNNDCFM